MTKLDELLKTAGYYWDNAHTMPSVAADLCRGVVLALAIKAVEEAGYKVLLDKPISEPKHNWKALCFRRNYAVGLLDKADVRALGKAFMWQETQQGYYFWENERWRIKRGEGLGIEARTTIAHMLEDYDREHARKEGQ
jgi:hypothetical protein